MEKALADYQAQANKPFDHETRMNDLRALGATQRRARPRQERNPDRATGRGGHRTCGRIFPAVYALSLIHI